MPVTSKSVLSAPAVPVREYQRAMAFNGDDDAPEVAHLDAPEPGGTADKVLLRFRGEGGGRGLASICAALVQH